MRCRRLANLRDLQNQSEPEFEFSPYDYKINFFENLDSLEDDACIQDCCRTTESYRLCRHEKEIRRIVRKGNFGFARVKFVESCVLNLLNQNKSDEIILQLNDSFERLIIHVLCRYYKIKSQSKSKWINIKAF